LRATQRRLSIDAACETRRDTASLRRIPDRVIAEAELMSRYCDGDAGAFRALYASVAPRLHDHLVAVARDRSLANALLEQTFLALHRTRGAYIRDSDPVPWIYAIARQLFVDEHRATVRRSPA
jgi:DNA-directed RNA polymerase specialized sigma24 family protein